MTELRTQDARNRPQTARDLANLKAIRYEDASNGTPPLPIATIHVPRAPSSSASSEHTQAKRPKTSPSPSPNISSRAVPRIHDELKRDSAIAPSLSTTDQASYAESQASGSVSGAARDSSLPTIIVHDDQPSSPIGRSRSPFARLRSKAKPSKTKEQSADKRIERINSFKGIQSNIPSSSFAGIDLEDLATDRIGFSQRGSLLIGGQKANMMAESLPNGGMASQRVGQSASNSELTEETPMNGLTTGRRKSSVHRLEESSKLLSAEEQTFSLRVRSMYEHGDERAADLVKPAEKGNIDKKVANGDLAGDSTPEPSTDTLYIDKTRQTQRDKHPALRSPETNVQANYARQPSERAGGIEDWDEIEGQDVDRYGFISARTTSRPATGEPASPRDGIQRVATSLRIEGNQPRGARKLRRGPSSASRASKTVPPRTSQDATIRGGSVHTIQSQRSGGHVRISNPFRSKDSKTVTEASDMLTLPPGLAEVAEEEDAGRTASLLKRREWEREAKWQKMARPLRDRERTQGQGGGMRFDFDTADSRLVSRTWKGIPDRWRATAWHCFMTASAKKRGGATDDDLIVQFHILQEQSCADDVQIDVDVPRTINLHIMFRRRYRGGQRLLFRVLHAISLYFPDTGYVQGMASLAATLLCYFDEETAFIMMVRLWQLRGLEQLFQAGFGGLMAALEEFEKDWLKGGDVAKKLDELGINSTAYGTRWYLTLFNMSIPFPAQLRVWDVFMLLGDATPSHRNAFGGADLDVLHATSASLIDATREIILDSDFENAMKVLTSFVPIKDEDLLMRVARTEWKMRKKRSTHRA